MESRYPNMKYATSVLIEDLGVQQSYALGTLVFQWEVFANHKITEQLLGWSVTPRSYQQWLRNVGMLCRKRRKMRRIRLTTILISV